MIEHNRSEWMLLSLWSSIQITSNEKYPNRLSRWSFHHWWILLRRTIFIKSRHFTWKYRSVSIINDHNDRISFESQLQSTNRFIRNKYVEYLITTMNDRQKDDLERDQHSMIYVEIRAELMWSEYSCDHMTTDWFPPRLNSIIMIAFDQCDHWKFASIIIHLVNIFHQNFIPLSLSLNSQNIRVILQANIVLPMNFF